MSSSPIRYRTWPLKLEEKDGVGMRKQVCPFYSDENITQVDATICSCSRGHYWRIIEGAIEEFQIS